MTSDLRSFAPCIECGTDKSPQVSSSQRTVTCPVCGHYTMYILQQRVAHFIEAQVATRTWNEANDRAARVAMLQSNVENYQFEAMFTKSVADLIASGKTAQEALQITKAKKVIERKRPKDFFTSLEL